jgi:two-component system nitrogen regulation sensor histidine kinase NtrY
VRVGVVVGGGSVHIEIADGGNGIGAILAGPALARSLGTTKAAGSGLGLPIAHKIVHEHNGTLRLEPRAEGGTLASVVLPLGERA